MRSFVLAAIGVMTVLGLVTPNGARGEDPVSAAKRKAENQRRKIEHKQRVAEMNRAQAKHRGPALDAATSAPPKRDFRGNPIGWQAKQEALRDFRGNATIEAGRKTTGSAPEFNAASAPPPMEALADFVKAGRSASSMEQLLYYLPAREQELLKGEQARYDPRETAARREQLRKLDPSIAEKSLTFLTNSPYTNRFQHLQHISSGILDVLSVKVEGNTATLVVATNNGGIVNGKRYGYGKAEVELVGEGNAWKFSKYNDSGWVYEEQPRSP